jgi:hypothetical protein
MQATFTLQSRARIDRAQVMNSVWNAGVLVALFLDAGSERDYKYQKVCAKLPELLQRWASSRMA